MKIRKYWNSISGTPKDLMGCYPMGGGGLLEAPYRHYFEVKHLRKIIHFHKHMNVLELGCGNGRWAVSIAPLVNSYTAIDFSAPALSIAMNRVQEARISNVNFYELPIVQFEGEMQYDIIYFSGVTQYLQDSEVKKVLTNLKPWITSSTIIIDRSTLNYKSREILDNQNYFTILRTPSEIAEIFNEYGFKKKYQKRSYRFLRGGRFFNSRPLIILLPKVSNFIHPVSYLLLFAFSWCADFINPILFEGGDRTHDFIILKMDDK